MHQWLISFNFVGLFFQLSIWGYKGCYFRWVCSIIGENSKVKTITISCCCLSCCLWLEIWYITFLGVIHGRLSCYNMEYWTRLWGEYWPKHYWRCFDIPYSLGHSLIANHALWSHIFFISFIYLFLIFVVSFVCIFTIWTVLPLHKHHQVFQKRKLYLVWVVWTFWTVWEFKQIARSSTEMSW